MERNQIPYFSKNCSIQRTNWTLPENSNAIPKPNYIAHNFNNYFVSITETTIYLYIYIYIYIYIYTIFQMRVVVQNFCNLLIKKK